MISLTNTHERIMHYQGLGKSDSWIAQKLGYSMSDFLTACAFINQWRSQVDPIEPPQPSKPKKIDRRRFNGAKRKTDSTPPKRRFPDRVEAMKKMRRDGAKVAEIAEAFKMSETAVYYNLTESAAIGRRRRAREAAALARELELCQSAPVENLPAPSSCQNPRRTP